MDTGGGGEAFQGVGGHGQEAVAATPADRADRAAASGFRTEVQADAGARQGAERVGSEKAGHHPGRDQGASRLGLHDPSDPSCSREVGSDTKNTTLHAAEQDLPYAEPKRCRWRRGQGGLDPARLVFIDELAAETNVIRLRGRSPRGERLVCHAPHGHGCTTACMTIEGASKTRAYVRKVLISSLCPKAF